MRKVYYSINEFLVDKIAPKERYHWSCGFNAKEGTIDDFVQDVCEKGFSWSQCYDECHRIGKNLQIVQLIGFDFESKSENHHFRLENALQIDFVKKHGWLVYTSPSHQLPEKGGFDRFRIIFALEAPLYPPEEGHQELIREYARALYGWLKDRMVSDMTAINPKWVEAFDDAVRDVDARCFCGNSKAVVHKFGNFIPEYDYADVIDDYREAKKASRGGTPHSKFRSYSTGEYLLGDEIITLGDGKEFRCDEITEDAVGKETTCFCPRHDDLAAGSAHLVFSKAGTVGVHCKSSKCNDGNGITYWRNEGTEPEQLEADLVIDVEFVGDWEQLPLLKDMPQKIIAIKSAKGTGKTRAVAGLFDEDDELYLPIHRNALGRSHKENFKASLHVDNVYDAKRLVCTPHSNHKIRRNKFKYIFCDEFEQYISAYAVDSNVREPYDSLIRFVEICNNSSKIILADAGLTNKGVERLCSWLGLKREDAFVVENVHTPKKKFPIQLYQSRNHMRAVAMERLLKVVSHSENIAPIAYLCSRKEDAEVTFQEWYNICGDNGKVYDPDRGLLITKDTTNDPRVIAFLENPKEEVGKYDFIAASPSLGTGIDIDDRERSWVVFQDVGGDSLTHWDVDQQGARFRNQCERHAWVIPVVHRNPVNDAVVKEWLEDFWKDRGWSPCGRRNHFDLCVDELTKRFASLNNLKGNLIKHWASEGWQITYVPKDAEKARDTQKQARLTGKNAKIAAFMKFAELDDKGRRKLDDTISAKLEMKQQLTAKEGRFCKVKFAEEIFGRPIDEDMASWLARDGYEKAQRGIDALSGDPEYHWICSLLEKSGLLKNGPESELLADRLNWNARIACGSLLANGFVEACEKKLANPLFKVAPRKNIRENPVRQLGALLDYLGLDLIEAERHRVSGVPEGQVNLLVDHQKKVYSTGTKIELPPIRYGKERKGNKQVRFYGLGVASKRMVNHVKKSEKYEARKCMREFQFSDIQSIKKPTDSSDWITAN